MKKALTSLKVGDKFKDKQTGKIYVLKMILDKHNLILEGETVRAAESRMVKISSEPVKCWNPLRLEEMPLTPACRQAA